MEQWLDSLAAGWNLLLLLLAVAGLGGFFYTVYLKRILRARRITHARERRLLREAAERQGRTRE